MSGGSREGLHRPLSLGRGGPDLAPSLPDYSITFSAVVNGELQVSGRKAAPGNPWGRDCRKSRFCSDGGKEDSVKETQEGCLSRSINDFFERSLFKKVAPSVSKRLFRHAGPQEIPGAESHRAKPSNTVFIVSSSSLPLTGEGSVGRWPTGFAPTSTWYKTPSRMKKPWYLGHSPCRS